MLAIGAIIFLLVVGLSLWAVDRIFDSIENAVYGPSGADPSPDWDQKRLATHSFLGNLCTICGRSRKAIVGFGWECIVSADNIQHRVLVEDVRESIKYKQVAAIMTYRHGGAKSLVKGEATPLGREKFMNDFWRIAFMAVFGRSPQDLLRFDTVFEVSGEKKDHVIFASNVIAKSSDSSEILIDICANEARIEGLWELSRRGFNMMTIVGTDGIIGAVHIMLCNESDRKIHDVMRREGLDMFYINERNVSEFRY